MKVINKKFFLVFLFLLITLSFKSTWLVQNDSLGKPGNDDLSHWLHAATIAYDFDLNYEFDYEVDERTFNENTNIPYHPPGSGYLSAPFVLVFSFLDTQPVDRLNPVGTFAYLGFLCSSLFYFSFGLYLLRASLSKKNLNNNFLILFSVFSGTILHYVFTRFVMSHSVEFFLCCLICYIFEKKEPFYRNSYFFILGVVYFLLSFTRPTTFIFSLCLIIVYLEKNNFNSKNITFISALISTISITHVLLSSYLYNYPSIFHNYAVNISEQDYVTTNLIEIFINLLKIPNLFFSFSFGIIWTIPVIFFGIISIFFQKDFYLNKNKFSKSFTFLFFLGAFLVAASLEGREVAFGQRLLIGLIPFCALRLSNMKFNKIIKNSLTSFSALAYLGYLYLYSSTNLTLKQGYSLWGTMVGFSGEKYTLYFFQELVSLENIISILGRSIYSINFFKFMGEDRIEILIDRLNFIGEDKMLKIQEFSYLFRSVNSEYLILINVLILIFSYILLKVMTENAKK